MQKELYKKYALVREQIANFEEQEAKLKEAIIEDMAKQGTEKVESNWGKFLMCTKKKWTYSKKVLKIEEELKIQKFTEQEKGIAKSEETKYLTFSKPKEE